MTTLPDPNPITNTNDISFKIDTVTSTDKDIPLLVDTINNTLVSTNNGKDMAQDSEIPVRSPELRLTKESDSPQIVVGGIVTYTITVVNTGDTTLENIIVSDILAPELEFISSSVRINNILQPLSSIISGVLLGTMTPGAVNVIKFQAKVLSKSDSGTISNSAIGQYDFRLAPNLLLQPGSNTSNLYTIDVLIADLKIIKTTNAKLVSIGDTITYTVKLINDGDIDLTNVLFKDKLPSNITLIDGSFTINGSVVNNINLEQGVVIPIVLVDTTVTITYKVTVLSSICGSKIINFASASFRFILPNETTGTGQTEKEPTSSTVVDVTLSNFKQLSVEEYLQIPNEKPDIETINTVNGNISIINHHIIQTAKASSNEGQNLNQYKLILHGILSLTVEYTACEPIQDAHLAYYNIPFSTYIVLPDDYIPGNNIDIDGVIEDIYYNYLDSRIFFINTTIFLNVQILNC